MLEREKGSDDVQSKSRDIRKPRAWLIYGAGGHEGEYVFSIEEMSGSNSFVPVEIGRKVEAELGKDWYVIDRGNRIEVRCLRPYGARDDEKVNTAFLKALGDEYEFLPVE